MLLESSIIAQDPPPAPPQISIASSCILSYIDLVACLKINLFYKGGIWWRKNKGHTKEYQVGSDLLIVGCKLGSGYGLIPRITSSRINIRASANAYQNGKATSPLT